MTHHFPQIDYTYNQLKLIVHNHIQLDSICDSVSRPLELDLMITFNLIVRSGFMTSRFDRYNIKIILVK